MSALPSLRRTAVGVAASVLLVAGVLGFAAAAGTVGAEVAAPAAVPAGAVALNNNQASADPDCPKDGAAYWHFILAPNNGTYTITTISLALTTSPGPGTEVKTFTGPAILPNGIQTDNVFVAVPAGHTLTDIVLGDSSYALYSGGTTVPSNFTLSHTCAGRGPDHRIDELHVVHVVHVVHVDHVDVSTSIHSSTSHHVDLRPLRPRPLRRRLRRSRRRPRRPPRPPRPRCCGTVQTTSTTPAEAATAVQAGGDLPYTGTDTAGMMRRASRSCSAAPSWSAWPAPGAVALGTR